MSIPSGCTFCKNVSDTGGSLGSRRSRTPTLSQNVDLTPWLHRTIPGTEPFAVRPGQTNCRRWLTHIEPISQDDVGRLRLESTYQHYRTSSQYHSTVTSAARWQVENVTGHRDCLSHGNMHVTVERTTDNAKRRVYINKIISRPQC